MVKLTILYQNKPVNSLVFDQSIIYFGRNASNDLSIDDPAVAPIHGTITLEGLTYIIKQIDSNYLLIVNGNAISKTRLLNGDKIDIDNYTIIFNSARIISSVNSNKATIITAPKIKQINIPNASIQIMSGPHIGRVMSLKEDKVSFCKGSNGIDRVEISKETEGYCISAKGDGTGITINNVPLEDKSIILNDTDILGVDDVSMQFFIEN